MNALRKRLRFLAWYASSDHLYALGMSDYDDKTRISDTSCISLRTVKHKTILIALELYSPMAHSSLLKQLNSNIQ